MAATTNPPSTSDSPATSEPPSTDGSRSSTPTLSVPRATVDKNTPDEGSKLKAFLSILRKFIGVTDIAAVRFSLPAQLMEPVPNLEYWNYLDRPEAFASIGDSPDPVGRMLGALRFWFTKDLKYVKGKPCKPYNSALGEFFRCNWEIKEPWSPLIGPAPEAKESQDPVVVSYITEQTSHHPPVSAFYIVCPAKGISANGYDQLSANFTGTRIRVSPGSHNLGIYITLHNHDETYNLTHPTAHLGGLLRGTLSITVADTCFVTCPNSKLKTILYYAEESWLGKTQNKVTGVIFKYDPDNDNIVKLKDVPDADVVARLEGAWHETIYYTMGSAPFNKSDKQLMVDLLPLWPAPKLIPPENDQLPNESRLFWKNVTEAITSKQFNKATTVKQELEERQREKAADRKARNVEWQPRFFTDIVKPLGRPELSADGKAAMEGLQTGQYKLEPSAETAA